VPEVQKWPGGQIDPYVWLTGLPEIALPLQKNPAVQNPVGAINPGV